MTTRATNWFDKTWFPGGVDLQTARILAPLVWKHPRRIRVSAPPAGLFSDPTWDVDIAAVFTIMAACPQHTFIVETSVDVQRMRTWICSALLDLSRRQDIFDEARHAIIQTGIAPDRLSNFQIECWPLPNIHLLLHVDDQDALDTRIGSLLQTPARVRGLSIDVSKETIHLPIIHVFGANPTWNGPRIDWIVARAGRAAVPDRLRQVVAQCAQTQTPIFLERAQIAPCDACVGRGIRREAGICATCVDCRGTGHAPSALSAGPGSRCLRGRIVDLPYLDGVQHLQIPDPATPATAPIPDDKAPRSHDCQPTSTWFTCRHCGKDAPAPHAGAADEGPCPRANSKEG